MSKKLKEAMNGLIRHIWAKANFKEATIHMGQPINNLIQVQE